MEKPLVIKYLFTFSVICASCNSLMCMEIIFGNSLHARIVPTEKRSLLPQIKFESTYQPPEKNPILESDAARFVQFSTSYFAHIAIPLTCKELVFATTPHPTYFKEDIKNLCKNPKVLWTVAALSCAYLYRSKRYEKSRDTLLLFGSSTGLLCGWFSVRQMDKHFRDYNPDKYRTQSFFTSHFEQLKKDPIYKTFIIASLIGSGLWMYLFCTQPKTMTLKKSAACTLLLFSSAKLFVHYTSKILPRRGAYF